MTFSGTSSASALLEAWPWDRETFGRTCGENVEAAWEGASRFGFRALSRGRWDQLQEQYMTYQQKLLDQIKSSFHPSLALLDPEATSFPPVHDESSHNRSSLPGQPGESAGQPQSVWYPPSCLIFVRNVHEETSKTILRTLFARRVFPEPSAAHSDGLDYVDYNKGMDSVCSYIYIP